jgi:dTDP-L-rhamnose 4-epimerase
MFMKVLVTGGAGFIGSHTVDLLLEKGYEVRVLDSLQPRVHPKGKPRYLPDEVEFIRGDVAKRTDLLKALKGVDFVYHLAAYQDYMTDFSTFFHVNAESTALLFELIVNERLQVKKIIFASSQAVAGEGRYICPSHGSFYPDQRPVEQLRKGDWEIKCPVCKVPSTPLLIDEETTNPHTAYGISKQAIEKLAMSLGKRYGIPTVAMRYTYVQGPRNSFYNAYSGICRIFALRILHGLPPVVYEDGQQVRDFINVKDVAEANLLVLEKDEANYQVFNVGGGRPVSVLDFARIMIEETGSKVEPVIPGQFRMGDTRHTVSDISKLKKLGWEPKIPVEKNVRQYLDWVSRQPDVDQYFVSAEQDMCKSRVICKVEQGT